jgi:protein required for attachment to host cells
MDVGNRWWDSDEDEEVQIDDEAEKIERMKRANESAQAWAKFFLRVTPPAPTASSSSTTLQEDLAQMQRTSEKPDTLRSEKRERDWLKKGKKHGDFSSGEGLDALKQAQQIAKEEQAKNLRTAAVSEKKAKSLAIAAASVTTGVPRKTIKKHFDADLTHGVAKKGPKPILDRNEYGICIEKKLVDHLIHCADIGLGLDWNLVEVYVVDMCKAYGITDDFVASSGWKEKFMARHPELTRRLGTRFECARAGAMNVDNISHFFDVVLAEAYAFVERQNGTPLEASSIWNVDEIGWNIGMDKQMILCRTNSKSTNTLNFNRGEHMTACCATTPEGFKTAMPVFYLLKGANITKEQVDEATQFEKSDPRRLRPKGTPVGSALFMTAKGYMTDEAWVAWCKLFAIHVQARRQALHRETANTRWDLVYLDGFGPHALHPEALKILWDARIYCVGMPSHTSHALQALDRSIFGALKKLVKKILARYQIEHQRLDLSKWEVPNLFQQAWQDAACESNAASGFATTGVFLWTNAGSKTTVNCSACLSHFMTRQSRSTRLRHGWKHVIPPTPRGPHFRPHSTL